MAYLDSARAIRQQGRDRLDAENIVYDTYLRDLREGFFYFQNQDVYGEEAGQRQYEAFSRAFEAKPDSLEDWYISQLFVLSADEFGDELPNIERADYVARLAEQVDTPALQEYLAGTADYFRTDPSAAPGGVGVGSDAAVEELIADYDAGSASDDQILSLLGVVIQQPERLEALDVDVAALRTRLVRESAVTDNIENPRTLVALAFQALREGDAGRGNQLFDQALTNAQSNAQRADFLYARAQAGLGNRSQLINRALQTFPSHGPSLYARAGLIADAVGRPSSLTGRFAYWCLADEYRNVAAVTSGSIAQAARRAAAQYERAGPSRESYFLEGYRPGQTVSASLGAYGSCSTRVR